MASPLGPEYALRWFTPGGEVDLCGHATLAAAFALWEEGRVDPGLPVRFSTASGVLTCRRDGEGWVAMDFPAEVDIFLRIVSQLEGGGRWVLFSCLRPCALAEEVTQQEKVGKFIIS